MLLAFLLCLNVFADKGLEYDDKLKLSSAEINWLELHPEISFTGDPNWLPYEAFEKDGNYIGIVADHLKLIEQKLSIRFNKIQVDTWTDAVKLAHTGQVTMLSETDDSELRNNLLFSRSYLSNPIVIVMNKLQGHVVGLEQLQNARIGLIKDYGYVTKIVSKYSEYNFHYVNNIQDGLIDVSTGKIDALLCTVTLCGYTLAELGLFDIKIVGKTEFNTRLAFAINPEFSAFIPILNKAISSITTEQRQLILDKWSPKQYYEKTDYQLAGKIFIAFIIFMAFLTYHQFQLRSRNRLLQQSEKRYARAVRGTSDGIWDWDLISDQVHLSQRWKELVGYAENEFENSIQSFWEGVHPEDVARVQESIDKHFIDHIPYDIEFRFRNKDASYRWYRSAGQAEFDQQGKPTTMAGAMSDITQRKRDRSLRQSRNKVLELTAKGESQLKILEAIVISVEEESCEMICSIMILDNQKKLLHFGAYSSLPLDYVEAVNGLQIGEGVGSCGTAAFTGKRVVVADIQSHNYWAGYTELAAKANLASCWSEPIFDSSGQVIGTFAVYQHKISEPTQHEILIIEQAATLAGIAIEKHRAFEELQLASLVYRNSSEAMLIFSAESLIIDVNSAFTEITGYSAEEVVGQKAEFLNSDFYEPHFYQAMQLAVRHTGSWQGEIQDRRKNGQVYFKWLTINTIFNEQNEVHRRVALFSDISERKKSEKIIWEQANYDSLTDLPNRNMFNDRLNQELKKTKRDGEKFALLLIDLDQFKEVNDTLGHDYGDILLIEAAQRITSCVRDSDTVARLGGDEFTIIITDIENNRIVEGIAQKILAQLIQPFKLGDDSVYISASIGITLCPTDTTEFESLLRSADQAMYQAKNNGRNCYQYFTPSMQKAAIRRMGLVGELRKAVSQQQFCVYYQPIVDLISGKVQKAEALIRWQHPKKGLILPDEFIGVSEETGMIVEIGSWVLYESAQQVAKWRKQFDQEFQISVNTSPVQYLAGGIDHVAWVEHLKSLRLHGDAIIIEITEGLMMDVTESITEQLMAFRNAGIQVALDDFGTGYSSLSYINKFDIDYIKIDQLFIKNIHVNRDNRVLCEAIIAMAHKLNLKVVAEGVETLEQKNILVEMNCDFAQGYYFSEPLSDSEFEKEFLIF